MTKCSISLLCNLPGIVSLLTKSSHSQHCCKYIVRDVCVCVCVCVECVECVCVFVWSVCVCGVCVYVYVCVLGGGGGGWVAVFSEIGT